MTWWASKNGQVSDPYKLLLGAVLDDAQMAINQGGAATTAYMLLQFEDMPAANRTEMNAALLRYCELDTLAMVMVLQAWQHWASEPR